MTKIFGKTTIKVAGTTFDGRQGKLWNLRKHMEGAYLTLRREKTNKEDPNAIAVIAHVPEQKPFKVGYVPRNKAYWMANAMDSGRVLRTSNPTVTGGNNGLNLGLTFNLAYELPNQVAVEVETLAAEEA